MSRCPALKSCTACNAASNCRWCGDMATGACYSNDDWTVTCMWSKYTCEEISKCYRTNPEFLGYGSPWVFVVNGIIAIVVVLLFTVFGMVLCSAFVNLSSKSEFVEDNRYFELSDFEQEESEDSSNDIAFPNDVDDTESDRWRHIPMLLRRTTPTCILLCEKYAIRICSALSLVTITIVIILICLSPHLPDFSICNSELGKRILVSLSIKCIDWRSLISTFENPSSGIQGEYILQASIYNPNKFDMVLTACTGYFKYANTNIGTFSIDNSHSDLNASFVVPAGVQ